MKDNLSESYRWYKEKLAQETIESLEKNNISACYVDTVEDVCSKVISLIPQGSKVGTEGWRISNT